MSKDGKIKSFFTSGSKDPKASGAEFDPIESAKRTIKTELKGIIELKNLIDESFAAAVEIIAAAKGKIIITGIGKSGHVGKKIAATMASTGTPAFFVHPSEASHGDLGMLTSEDVVVAISKSGESKELSDIVTFCKRYGISLIGIAQIKDSSLMKQSDIRLLVPDMPEACPLGVAPTTSTSTTMILGDAIAMALLEKKQFSEEQFKARHPGGKLGQSLIKVADLMHVGDKMPLINIEKPLKEAVEEMTKKKKGCVGILDDEGDLVGVITDGDLRRHLSNDFYGQAIKDIMTPNPIVIAKEMLAVEATSMLNKMEITNIFIGVGRKPIGVLHIHDCLRAGIL